MSSPVNKRFAEALRKDCPTGTVSLRSGIAWLLPVVYFLLCRYIDKK